MRFGLLVIMLWPFFVSAQQFTQTLRGTVTDKDSKTALVGVTVIVTDNAPQLAAVTNDNGEFVIPNVAVGRRTVYAGRLGYQPVTLNNIVVTSGKELRLLIEMEPQVYQSQAVIVTDSASQRETVNPLVTISGQSFSPEETRRYAGSRADPSRMVSNFAGVNGGNDSRNEIIVRGNSPIGVLWQLEGMEIPNPNHFSGVAASGGALSILNNELLSQSDFLTGAFPAEYGNKTAAVFDLRLRNGNNDKHEYTFAAGINGVEAGAEGPFTKNKRSSYLFNYRYSSLALFHALGFKFGISGSPTYQDATLKLHFPSNDNRWTTDVFFIGGYSNVKVLSAEKDSSDWTFTDANEDVNYGTAMYAAGINLTRFVKNNGYWRIGLVNGASMLDITLDTLFNGSDKMRLITNKSVEGQAAAKLSYTKRFTGRNTIRTGVQLQVPYYDYLVRFRDPVLGIYLDRLRGTGNTQRAEGYVHWQYRSSDRLKFNSGLYYQFLFLNGSQSLEPRLGVSYKVGKHNLKAAYGVHSQMQPLVVYYLKTYDTLTHTYTQTNQQLDFTRAHHFIVGDEYQPSQHWTLKTEAYVQYLFHAPVEKYKAGTYSLLNAGGDVLFPNLDSLASNGEGLNYGVELTIEKTFAKHWYGLATASLFKSRYTGSDNVWRNTKFDNNFIFNCLGGYEWNFGKEHKNSFSLDIRVNYSGGRRYTPIDVDASIAAQEEVRPSHLAYTKRYPDYFRADAKAAININQRNVTHGFYVTVENVTNHRNVLQELYQPNTQRVRTDYQLGLFPYGGYRVQF